MYNTYSSYSSTVAFRTTYFGFNDYYTCFSPNYRCPSNYYCHCCCSFTVNSSKLMLPMNINPNLLYGLKQSTLIQCPPSRRVFLGSCDGYCSRSSIYDVGRCRCCCGEACCVKKGGSCNEKGLRKSVGVDRIRGERDFRCNALEERKSGGVDRVLGRKSEGVDRIRGRVIRNERDFRCTALGERKSGSVDRVLGRKSAGVDKIRVRVIRGERDFCCNALDDAEAMLSLLSEKGIDECVVVRDTRKRTSKDTRVVRDENVATEKWNDVRGNSFSGSGYLESKSKKEELSSGRDHFREEGHTRKEERKSNVVDEDMGLRRRESGSSYYSVLESGEFESDSEVDFEEERFVGESSTRQEKDLRKVGGVVISEVTDDVLESSKDEKDQRLVSNRCDDVRVGSSTEWDWRKKSEKKLSDESSEVIKSRNESILRQSKLSQVDEKSSIIASSSKKQFSNIEEESTLGISSQRQSRSRTRKDDSLSEYSKSSGWNEQSISSQLTEQMSNRVSEQHLVSGSQHEQSTSGASLSGRLKSRIETDNQASEYLISSQQHEESSLTNRTNVESPSTSTRRPIQGNGPMVVVGQSVQETGCDYCITCGRSVQESKIESNIERESRRGKQEVGASSSHTLVVEENKKSDRLNVEQYSESLDYDYGYDRSTLRIQKQPQMRKKKFEDTLTSVKSPSDAEILQVGLGDRVVKETESRKVLQIGTSDSQVHSTSGEISRHSASDRRKYDEQTYSTSKLTSIEELVEKHTTRLITDVQEYVLQVGLTGNVSGEINTSQLTLGATSQAGAQQVNEVERTSDLQLSVTSPTFQSIEGKSSDSELENSIFRTSTGSEVDGYGGYSQPQATRLSSFDETNQSGIRFAEESSLVDAISSVERMHESSSQIVHEFVEKTRHDSSVSETKLEKESSNDSLLGEAGLVKRDSGLVSESSGTKGLSDNMWDAKDHSVDEVSESESELREAEISKNDVARRTGRSLWNIVDGLFRLRWRSVSETQKSPVKSNQQRSSYDSASAETWFSGNEHDEGMKREQITLSQEPTSSDQPSSMITPSRSRHGDRKKKQSISVPPETTSELPVAKESASKSRKKDRRKKEETALDQSLHRKTTNKSQKGDARLTSLDDRLGPVELHVSSSASAAQGGLVSGSVSIGAKTDLEITQQTSHPSPISPFVPSFGRLRRSGALKENEQFEKIEEQTISTGEQRDSIPSARQLARLDAFEETEEAERNQERISSTIELKGHSVEVRKSSVPTSEEIDTEIKRKKLQRSNQVISDRYDEWEDAYRLENEQRKVDEIFMREALAEAMKAADSWEVPVGAVLVQNGKVIARGYNLVEELRDSTAHAEMICIREASNVLKTWRLSETTLYVTLEPCPMCAGAILQARIGTLVWGAPNKLLGADGSWIRLFPEGVEGEERSEVADRPTPPVHPFHPKMKIRRGILESECAQIMQQFFQLRRRKEKGKEKGNKSDGEGQPSCLPVPHNPTKLLRKMHGVFHIRD